MPKTDGEAGEAGESDPLRALCDYIARVVANGNSSRARVQTLAETSADEAFAFVDFGEWCALYRVGDPGPEFSTDTIAVWTADDAEWLARALTEWAHSERARTRATVDGQAP